MAKIVISGARPDEWIRFTPMPEISTLSFHVTACLGGRTVSNNSLSLLGAAGFLAALAEFERTRLGEAVLEGTYDFRLIVRPYGRTGAAWLAFRLADWIFLEDDTQGRHVLEAGFVIAGESVGRLVRDFKGLLAPDPRGSGA